MIEEEKQEAAQQLREMIFLHLWANHGGLVMSGVSPVSAAGKFYDDIAQEIVSSLRESGWSCL